MAVFNVAVHQITANVELHTASVAPPGKFTQATIQLVDPNGDWPAVPDPTRHIIIWGLQMSTDGGANFEWGPILQQDEGGLPFGTRDRSGGMPALIVGRGDIPQGARLRLAILTDADVRLGAQVVTS